MEGNIANCANYAVPSWSDAHHLLARVLDWQPSSQPTVCDQFVAHTFCHEFFQSISDVFVGYRAVDPIRSGTLGDECDRHNFAHHDEQPPWNSCSWRKLLLLQNHGVQSRNSSTYWPLCTETSQFWNGFLKFTNDFPEVLAFSSEIELPS